MAFSQVTRVLVLSLEIGVAEPEDSLSCLARVFTCLTLCSRLCVLQRSVLFMALFCLVFIACVAAADRQPLFADQAHLTAGARNLPQRFQEMVQRRWALCFTFGFCILGEAHDFVVCMPPGAGQPSSLLTIPFAGDLRPHPHTAATAMEHMVCMAVKLGASFIWATSTFFSCC